MIIINFDAKNNCCMYFFKVNTKNKNKVKRIKIKNKIYSQRLFKNKHRREQKMTYRFSNIERKF